RGPLQALRVLCRPDSQGRQARRSADRAGRNFRARHQSQDRRITRHQDSARDPGASDRGDRMKRRAFLSLGALGLACVAQRSLGQSARRVYRIGLLSSSGEASMVGFVQALWAGLREHGYVDGQNMILDPRYAAGEADRLPLLARELVAAKPDLIV